MRRLVATLVIGTILAVFLAAPSPGLSRGGSSDVEFAEHFLVEYNGAEAKLEAAVKALGGSLERVHPKIKMAKVSGLSDKQATALAKTAGVKSVTRDVVLQWVPNLEDIEWSVTGLPDDAASQGHDPTTAFFFPIQWNMHIIDADDAWNAGFSGSPNVSVAIVDTGIDPFHMDIAGLVDAGRSIAFTPSLNPAGPDWGDDHWHGSHVGGTVVSNGIGTSGVAPHTTLIAVKVLDVTGSGTFADVIAGIVHAADVNADVINMSLGAMFPKNVPGGGQLVAALNKAVNYANGSGVLVVSSAGNASLDLDHSRNLTSVPCESGAGICISATGPTDELASYSNFGRSAINLAAPGGDFVVTGDVQTSTVLAPCSTLSLVIPICQLGGFYVFAQGTSMSAPHVSGAAALLDAQHGGGLNAGQLKTRLQQTADDLGKPGADPIFGRGRLNVFNLVTR